MPPRSSSEGGGLGADPVAIAAQHSSVHRISNAAITRNQFIAPSNYPMFGSHPGHSREIPPRRSDLRSAHPYAQHGEATSARRGDLQGRTAARWNVRGG